MSTTNRQWLLDKRPRGELTSEHFRWNQAAVGEPGEGQVLIRNEYVSCDPTQRGWAETTTYYPPVQLGDVMRAFAIGEVIASRSDEFKVGDRVQGLFGWQDYAVADQEGLCPIWKAPEGVSSEHAMSAMGITGMAAYFGLMDVGRPRAGDTVLISAAAGATGSIAGQIAKNIGCRVVGIAGGSEKCTRLVEELGFDAAIDYKTENILTRLRKTCPNGIDIYFDNVGGRILDAALAGLAMRGRVVLCGAISGYNHSGAGAGSGPSNYLRLLVQRGRMEGFIVGDYLHRAAECADVLRGYMERGTLKDRVDVIEGLERAPEALGRLFRGENQGKQLVKL